MAFNLSSSWRGTVGCIKPIYRPGNLEAFIRLLPVGIGVVPMWLGNPKTEGGSSIAEMTGWRLEKAKEKVAELAELKVDIIHIESGPLLMVPGYKASEEIVKSIEQKHGIPIFTTGQTHVAALKALGVKRVVGATYVRSDVAQKCGQYLSEAGFDVMHMESVADMMGVPFSEASRINPKDVYSYFKQLCRKYKDVQGIYMLGSAWPILDIISTLEGDLEIPVVAAVPARIWYIQKMLKVREPRSGYGRLLEELP